jgi:hypothetical protein
MFLSSAAQQKLHGSILSQKKTVSVAFPRGRLHFEAPESGATEAKKNAAIPSGKAALHICT